MAENQGVCMRLFHPYKIYKWSSIHQATRKNNHLPLRICQGIAWTKRLQRPEKLENRGILQVTHVKVVSFTTSLVAENPPTKTSP